VDLDVTDHYYSVCIHQIPGNSGTGHQLFLILYNILIEFGIPNKPIRLIKHLNETYSKVYQAFVCISCPEWFEIRRCFVAIAFQLYFRIFH